jgi:xylan 1,4-beta-xylosidase
MRLIKADINIVKGNHSKMFKECVGCGRAYEGLLAEQQRHMKIVSNECGFKYLRFHGLLHDDMAVYNEDSQGNPIYNWQYIDLLYDYILSIGMKPFVELGFMPQALASGIETVFWWKGNVTPPKSYEKWEKLIYELVMHFTRRYGHNEVSKWYFEVWNEPNLSGFFTGDMAEYFKLYEVTSKIIKNISSDYRVGGPSTAGCGWVTEFIEFCYNNKVPADFLSTHTYGVDGFLDEFGVQQLFLDSNPGAVSDDIITVHEQVKASPMPELEIHFTEWSTSYSPNDPIHDSYHSAPYILSKIKKCEGKTNSMSYWVFSDIFEEPAPPKKHFHGGFGLLNVQGLKKPSFFAYKYLNQLGDLELKCNDENAWVCKSDKGVQALLWDYTHIDQNNISNQTFYTKDLPSLPAEKSQLCLSNLKPGKHQLSVYSVGYKQNDVYTEFLDINYSGTMSKEQIEILNSKTTGLPVIQTYIMVKEGIDFIYEIEMRQNDVYLVIIESI